MARDTVHTGVNENWKREIGGMNGGQLIKGHVPMGDVHQAFRPFQPMAEHWFSPRLQHHRDMQIFLPSDGTSLLAFHTRVFENVKENIKF